MIERIVEGSIITAASGEERRQSLIRLQELLDSEQFGVLEFAGVVNELIRLKGNFREAKKGDKSWAIPLQVPETGKIVTVQAIRNNFEQTHTIRLDGAEAITEYIGDHGPYFPFSLTSVIYIKAAQTQFRSPFHGHNQDVPAHKVTVTEKIEGKDLQQRLKEILGTLR